MGRSFAIVSRRRPAGGGTDQGRRSRVGANGQENPRRRPSLGDAMRAPGVQTPAGETTGRQSGQCLPRIWAACENRNDNPVKYLRPPPPSRDLGQIIRPHQPDETNVGKPSLQLGQSIGGIRTAQMALDVGDANTWVARKPVGRRQPVGQGRHSLHRLQRILRRHQPPHLVHPEQFQGAQADVQVPGMGRVERAAEQPHGSPPTVAMHGRRHHVGCRPRPPGAMPRTPFFPMKDKGAWGIAPNGGRDGSPVTAGSARFHAPCICSW